jgi:hypothetical protein
MPRCGAPRADALEHHLDLVRSKHLVAQRSQTGLVPGDLADVLGAAALPANQVMVVVTYAPLASLLVLSPTPVQLPAGSAGNPSHHGTFSNVAQATSAGPDQGGEGQQVAGRDVHAVGRRRCRAVRAPFPGPR